ncbi:hypothetical protein [Nannocystis bainbridge]|uniref:Uncharacterized protein n=1 Tax=Nannocystis bainbridge TaxID=2995303 RepID=A0ABT5EB65_9BACT|nr:hypothetical protein [Nannocystis bainbridge]MDC0722102.1 hypothetical protein [Nannocystis bainbridge]
MSLGTTRMSRPRARQAVAEHPLVARADAELAAEAHQVDGGLARADQVLEEPAELRREAPATDH